MHGVVVQIAPNFDSKSCLEMAVFVENGHSLGEGDNDHSRAPRSKRDNSSKLRAR